jgi:hypothetical protein
MRYRKASGIRITAYRSLSDIKGRNLWQHEVCYQTDRPSSRAGQDAESTDHLIRN